MCFKGRKVFSLSRPDAVFIFNEYRYAEEKRRGEEEDSPSLSLSLSPFSFNAAHGRSSTPARNYAYRVPTMPTFLPHRLILFFLRAFYWHERRSNRMNEPPPSKEIDAVFYKKNSNINFPPYFVVVMVFRLAYCLLGELNIIFYLIIFYLIKLS